jgi:DNA-binding response OmpR family regulator
MQKKLNILIVEDEIVASTYLSMILDEIEYLQINNTYEATNAYEALEIIKQTSIDIVFMDINLDGNTDGISCVKQISDYAQIPIIYTTARNDTKTILRANETYIFGYLIKPFTASSVEATLAVALNNFQKNSKDEIKKVSVGEVEYILSTQTFCINHKSIDLTKKEIDILDLFFKNKNINISYDTLRDIVWKDEDISNSTIRDRISKIKKKIPQLNIKNISGIGYVLRV